MKKLLSVVFLFVEVVGFYALYAVVWLALGGDVSICSAVVLCILAVASTIGIIWGVLKGE